MQRHATASQPGAVFNRAVRILGALVAVGLLGSATPRHALADEPKATGAAAGDMTAKQIFQHALTGTALVVRTSAEGQVEGNGTGWMLDKERKLLITNHHVVVGKDTVMVYFPEYKDGKLISDMSYYFKEGKGIKGTVFLSEPERDLGVVQLESLPDGIQAFPLAADSASPGDAVHSVGNPEGRMWFYTGGHVRGVYATKYALSGGQNIDAQIVETDSPTNHGDSGGPVFNAQGELAAVVSSGTDGVRLITQFIDVSEVKKFYEEVNKFLDPKTAAEFMARGQRLFETGRLDRAFDDFTQATRLDRTLAEAYSRRGVIFRQRGDYVSAIGDFNECISLDPKFASAYQGRGLSYVDQGDGDKAIADFTEAIRINPETAENYGYRGLAFARKGDYVSALGDYDRALAIDPKNATVLLNRGEAHYAREEFDAAGTDYLACIDADPSSSMAYIKLGYVLLYKKNNVEQAMPCFNRAIELNALSSFNYNERGNAYYYQKNFELAAADYGTAINLQPTDPVLYNNRGDSYYALGNYQSAIQDYGEAIRLNPSNATYRNNRGISYHLLGNYNEAIPDYSEAIRLNPMDPVLWDNRGNAYFKLANYDLAISDFSSAIGLAPEKASYYNDRGNAHFMRSETNEAQADFDKATSLDSTATSGQFKLLHTRYLQVANKTDETLKVYFLYHTKTQKGDWAWFPGTLDAGTSVVVEIKAGETVQIYHNDFKVHADTIRIWAVGETSGLEWLRDRDQDVSLVTEQGGYVGTTTEPTTYSFTK